MTKPPKAQRPTRPTDQQLALAVFRQVASDPKAPASAKVSAAQSLHDIEFGRPGVTRPPDVSDVASLSDPNLVKLLESVAAELDRRKPGLLDQLLQIWADDRQREPARLLPQPTGFTRGDRKAVAPPEETLPQGPRWPPPGPSDARTADPTTVGRQPASAPPAPSQPVSDPPEPTIIPGNRRYRYDAQADHGDLSPMQENSAQVIDPPVAITEPGRSPVIGLKPVRDPAQPTHAATAGRSPVIGLTEPTAGSHSVASLTEPERPPPCGLRYGTAETLETQLGRSANVPASFIDPSVVDRSARIGNGLSLDYGFDPC